MRSLSVLFAILFAISAHGDSFADRMREANSLVSNGNFEGALALYQDLKIDDPESDRIAHNMGVAKMRYADSLMQNGSHGDAVKALEEADAHFYSAMEMGNDEIIQSAEFAAANTSLKSGDAHKELRAYQNALESYEQAISDYEDILRRDPDHVGAKRNRELAKLRLKELMRDTPPEEQEQQQQDQGQDENQQQEGDGEQQEGDQNEQQQQEGEGGSDEGDQEQQQNQQQPGENEQQEGESEDQNATPEDSDEEQFDLEDMKEADGEPQENNTGNNANEDETETKAPTEKPSQQSIEALLQSLEQMDNRLQHDARTTNERSNATKRWW